MTLTAVSLFSSGGIGDLALRATGFQILTSNELLLDRHEVFAHNFRQTRCITGNIWDCWEDIVESTANALAGNPLVLLYATPPCQGMSKNGRGKLLSAVRSGKKPTFDERNRLIIPAMHIAERLKPEIVLLENVPEMATTVIVDEDGEAVRVLDYIGRRLGPEYVGRGEVVEFADYGVPQCRQRLITVFSRLPTLRRAYAVAGSFMPPPTHSRDGRHGLPPWRTVRETISDLPPLDAGAATTATSSLDHHRVPLLDPEKHWWVASTPENQTAFNNQCVRCGFDGNPSQRATRNAEGINRTSRSIPVQCTRCGSLLPRPVTWKDGKPVLMKGFTSAYKRMSYDRPASALTRNLSYACSDNKLHPEQNRVLSLLEAFRLHTIDRYDYEWKRADGRKLAEKTIREVIGESIPPFGFEQVTRHVVAMRGGDFKAPISRVGPLFAHPAPCR